LKDVFSSAFFALKFEFTSLEESIPDKESEIYRNKGFEIL
jgi:hypothetical protein